VVCGACKGARRDAALASDRARLQATHELPSDPVEAIWAMSCNGYRVYSWEEIRSRIRDVGAEHVLRRTYDELVTLLGERIVELQDGSTIAGVIVGEASDPFVATGSDPRNDPQPRTMELLFTADGEELVLDVEVIWEGHGFLRRGRLERRVTARPYPAARLAHVDPAEQRLYGAAIRVGKLKGWQLDESE
jgi:hypothetical protein